MRLLVFGSRTWNNRSIMEAVLVGLRGRDFLTIIEGEARGADKMAAQIAKGIKWPESLRWEIVPFPADWDRHGKAAGPIRNRAMIEEGKPEQAVGFVHGLTPDGLPVSPGSRNIAEQLRKAGIPTFYVVAPEETG